MFIIKNACYKCGGDISNDAGDRLGEFACQKCGAYVPRFMARHRRVRTYQGKKKLSKPASYQKSVLAIKFANVERTAK